MHFLEDGGSRGFRHWKWQRLAPSLCLWNALMNFTLFPVITNKQEELPRGCAWHAVRSEHPLHSQSGYRSEQRLVLMMHLFRANSDWSCHLPGVGASVRHCCFHAHHLVSLFGSDRNHHTNNVNIIYGVGLAACNSVPCQSLRSVHPFSISKHLFLISVTGYNLDRSQAHHMTFHSHNMIGPTCVSLAIHRLDWSTNTLIEIKDSWPCLGQNLCSWSSCRCYFPWKWHH